MTEQECLATVERYFTKLEKENTKTVTHIVQGERYFMTLEQAASATKGILGFKVQAKGDDIAQVVSDVRKLAREADVMAGEG